MEGGEGILVSFIPASNEPSGHACMSIWATAAGVFDRSVCAGLSLRLSNRARQNRIKDSRIPLNAVAARKEKVGQECWCGDGLV